MVVLNGIYFSAPSSMSSILEEDKEPQVLPYSKLICTVGPSCSDVATLSKMLTAGMSVARFDLSYGDASFHQENILALRKAAAATRKMAAVMLDTAGPEIFVLNRPAEAITIEAGQTIVITCDKTKQSNNQQLVVSYPSFQNSGILPGSSIFVGQYLFTGSETTSAYLSVQQILADSLICVSNNSCQLEGIQLTVHIANMKNEADILSDTDLEALRVLGASNRVDYVSLSFCRNAQDIKDCRTALEKVGLRSTQVLAKIESKEGLSNYKEIVEAADAVIFSRGNIGICLDAEKVFLAQKMLLQHCNLSSKPVFVTRVVDTMCDAPRPTRAEATDVANLVLDGADGILLGAETFRGKYVVSTLQTVAAICKQAERCFNSQAYYRNLMEQLGAYTLHPNISKTEAIASTAVRVAGKVEAALILAVTVTGKTPRMLAKYKPSQPILALVCQDQAVRSGEEDDGETPRANSATLPNVLSPMKSGKADSLLDHSAPQLFPHLTADGVTWNTTGSSKVTQCLLYRGVDTMVADEGTEGTAKLDNALRYARSSNLIKPGDRVVVIQCPRVNIGPTMDESGQVTVITVSESTGVVSQTATIGSVDDLNALS